ncbi:DNA-binding transcriptional regulator, MarR family [Microbacterium sp. cf046]|uniref:MarR family winged helix-turn-helix transcriptional regulator n=1 Tax=Microbacterium sp. cf046 TaxID=1761803 RepID=UPI0008E3673F|nr:MarR family transcriptional regulator [Microbacterium sp. cf046]SFR89521.1 DNA-binding transcriptional regulator, MarR family [Microbacterium sp. cf046]
MPTDPTEAASAWLDGTPYRLWRANQALHRRVVEAIEDLGVTVTQLGITVHLDELGHMSASDLARLFRLTPQSVTTALGHLEGLGWVRRVPHPVHKRVIWYEVTTNGLDAAKEGRARVAQVNAEVDALLADFDRGSFKEALTLIAVMDDDLPAGTMWPVQGRSASSA